MTAWEAFARHYIRLQSMGKRCYCRWLLQEDSRELRFTIVNKQQGKGLLGEVFGLPTNKKLNFSVERTLTEIARCAFVEPALLFRADGTIKRLDDWTQIPPLLWRAVELGSRGKIKKVKLNDKLRALDMLARYHKLFGRGPHSTRYRGPCDCSRYASPAA